MSEPAGPAVHQLVPRLEPRDATGNHTLLLRDGLRSAGVVSDVFVHETLEETRAETVPLGELAARVHPDDVLVYQFSTASPIADLLCERSERLIVNHHNVTPPALFASWDPAVATAMRSARRQLRRLAARAALGIADSEFNRRDLEAAGFRASTVVPVLFDPERGREPGGRPAPSTGATWLFVGRVVPSKAQHRLVMALWVHRRLYDPGARLVLVAAGGHPVYTDAVERFARALGLEQAVTTVGGADEAALAALYRSSDVFVSLSEHEGFGIPLVEAMSAGLPVVALGAGAVPETVGPGGLVLDSAEPLRVAAAVHRVLADPDLRAGLAAAGRRQAGRFALAETRRRAVETVLGVVRGTGAAVASGAR